MYACANFDFVWEYTECGEIERFDTFLQKKIEAQCGTCLTRTCDIRQGKDHEVKNNFVLCGNLNSKPGGLVHTYISTGEVSSGGLPSFNNNWLECPLRHLLLESIHAKHDDHQAENIEYTNCTADFRRVIDYIFYPQSLNLEKVLSAHQNRMGHKA